MSIPMSMPMNGVASPAARASAANLWDAQQLLRNHLDGAPSWGDVDGTTLVCRQVRAITHDVATFLFEPVTPALFRHDAGQFVTLYLQIDGVSVSRCYTISSPPTRPHLLSITVKRQPGGLVSNWLHDTVVPGVRISADGPFGSFTLPTGRPGRYLFLSGGSGITPLMSMTRTLYDLGCDDDVIFLHSARTPSDIVFRRELDAIAATAPNIRVFHVCERDSPMEPWGGLTGLLSVDMLRLLVPDLAQRLVYCCGPAHYMAAAQGILGRLGFDLRNYYQESFSFEDLSVKDFAGREGTGRDSDGGSGGGSAGEGDAQDSVPALGSATTYTVEFARSGQTFPCRADEFVLDAAYAAGLAPASSCGQGMCGTCKSTMLAGTVDMQHNGGIRPREIAANKVLICCSTPTSDLTIDA